MPDILELATRLGAGVGISSYFVAMGLVLVFATYCFAVYSPIFIPVAIVWRHRKTMKRRMLFFGWVSMGSYGFLLGIMLAIELPIGLFAVYLAPMLKALGYLENPIFLPFLSAFDFSVKNWFALVLPVQILACATVVSIYLSRHWDGIVKALYE